jgi:hypothetical protein
LYEGLKEYAKQNTAQELERGQARYSEVLKQQGIGTKGMMRFTEEE